MDALQADYQTLGIDGQKGWGLWSCPFFVVQWNEINSKIKVFVNDDHPSYNKTSTWNNQQPLKDNRLDTDKLFFP